MTQYVFFLSKIRDVTRPQSSNERFHWKLKINAISVPIRMSLYKLKCFLGNKAYTQAFHNFKAFVMNHNFDLKLWDFNWTIQGCLQVEIKHSLCLPYRLKGWTQLLTFVTLSNTPSENRALVEYGGF